MDGNACGDQHRSMINGTVLAVLAALLFGTAQFLNARLAARMPGVAVARWTLAGAALATGVAAAVLGSGPGLPAGAATWALLSGAGGALGAAALYRSLESGRVTVAIPIATATTTAIPVAVGLLVLGEEAGVATGVGVVAAIAAIILVTGSRGATDSAHDKHYAGPDQGPAAKSCPDARSANLGATVGLPLLAGVGFAVELVGISRFPSSHLVPLLFASFIVSVLVLLPIRAPAHHRPRPRRHDTATALAAGVLTATAMATFHTATQFTGLGTASVIVGLYPAVPVVLAVALLGERPGPTRIVGLACAVLAVLTIGSR